MATKYIEIVAGPTDARYPVDRSSALAAGIYVDSSDLFQLKYLSNGVVRKPYQGFTPIAVSAATLSLTVALHDGMLVVLNNVGGCTVTLPAAVGSGALFRLFVGTSLTGGSLIAQVANSNDYLRGQAWTVAAANAGFLTANTGTVNTESDTVTFNRSTTGLGTIGDYIEFTDIEAHVWAVEADYASSGTAATPFSAAV